MCIVCFFLTSLFVSVHTTSCLPFVTKKFFRVPDEETNICLESLNRNKSLLLSAF